MAAHLSALAASLVPAERDRESATTLQEFFQRSLAGHGVEKTFMIGSYPRKTENRRKDIDVMVVLDNETSASPDLVRAKLRFTLKSAEWASVKDELSIESSRLVGQRRSISLKLEGSVPDLDFVPAVKTLNGFEIFDKNEGWIETDPKQVEEQLKACRRVCGNGGLLSDVIRLLKHFNVLCKSSTNLWTPHYKPLPSIVLEVMLHDVLLGYDAPSTLEEAVCYAFSSVAQKLDDYSSFSIPGSESEGPPELKANPEDVAHLFSLAASYAQAAIQADCELKSLEFWSEIFPDIGYHTASSKTGYQERLWIWNKALGQLGLTPRSSLRQCKLAVRDTFGLVNISDFLESLRFGAEIEFFPSVRDLRRYCRDTGKFVPAVGGTNLSLFCVPMFGNRKVDVE